MQADAAKAITDAAISLPVTFSRLQIEISVAKTIVPPVTIGYCTDAGRYKSAIKSHKLPILLRVEYPVQYIADLKLILKLLSRPSKISSPLRKTVHILVSIIKLPLSTQSCTSD